MCVRGFYYRQQRFFVPEIDTGIIRGHSAVSFVKTSYLAQRDREGYWYSSTYVVHGKGFTPEIAGEIGMLSRISSEVKYISCLKYCTQPNRYYPYVQYYSSYHTTYCTTAVDPSTKQTGCCVRNCPRRVPCPLHSAASHKNTYTYYIQYVVILTQWENSPSFNPPAVFPARQRVGFC